ncbi:hypothetical protein ACH5RR_001528 [Cinchona calisaya]|uniref:SWIM-type domain-containing protein n=1 Tax=Cinchona calisaya TaxID=153742 RepID=A0ABD3B3M4_9GENT
MIFVSEEDAYNTYNTYAITKGFGVRRGTKRYLRNGDMNRCVFHCSNEGYSSTRALNEERKRERLAYRCGCLARIRFKIENGIWEIIEFNDLHNHPFVQENQRHFVSSARHIPEVNKSISSSLVDVGVKPKMAFRYLSGEARGIANLGYTETDFNNYMQKRRQTMLSAGDAKTLIDYFKNLQNEDTRFFYTFQLDNDGRMCNFLWRDGVSKLHFDCFGDVIIFDTTYHTNRYNMICAPFVGVNNHWKNIFFGCAFMTDESTSLFVWVFKSFLDSMGGKAPKTIFTDQAYAIGLAIEMVFPSTVHRLCGWHIEKNAKENIPHLFKQVGFKEKYFNKLLWDCESEIEFELTWKNMVDEWECGENTWLQRLYNLREKWCPAFSRCTFSADIKSTQRSESTNRIFNEMGCKMMSLTEFVNHYERKLVEMRNGETEDDYKNRGKPKILITDCGILNHAANIYTNTIFFRFQEEMLNSISEEVVNFSIEGASRVYTLQRSEDKRTHIVQFDSSNHQTVCSCHKFETLGWLCCHILRVFNTDLRFHSIPMEFVLSR